MGHHLSHIHLAPLAPRVGSEALDPRNHLLYSAGFEQILRMTLRFERRLCQLSRVLILAPWVAKTIHPNRPRFRPFFIGLGGAVLLPKVFCPKQQAISGVASLEMNPETETGFSGLTNL